MALRQLGYTHNKPIGRRAQPTYTCSIHGDVGMRRCLRHGTGFYCYSCYGGCHICTKTVHRRRAPPERSFWMSGTRASRVQEGCDSVLAWCSDPDTPVQHSYCRLIKGHKKKHMDPAGKKWQ